MDFKEHRLVFMGDVGGGGAEGGGESGPSETAQLREQVGALTEQVKVLTEEVRSLREEVRRNASAERREASQEPAAELTQDDRINKALENLDQVKFDDFMHDLRHHLKGTRLGSDNVDKLVKFAEGSDEDDKNFDKIFHALDGDQIKVDEFSTYATQAMIDHYGSTFGGDKNKLAKFVGKFIKTGATADTLIKAAKDESAILEETFKEIKDTEIIGQLSPEALVILIEEMDVETVMASKKITPDQKAKLLTAPELDQKDKLVIFDDLKGEHDNLLSRLDEKSFQSLVEFAIGEKSGKAFKTITERFSESPEVINKMNHATRKLVFEQLHFRGEDEIFATLREALTKQNQWDLWADEKWSVEARTKIKIGMDEKAAEPAAEAAPTKPAPAPAPAAARQADDAVPAPRAVPEGGGGEPISQGITQANQGEAGPTQPIARQPKQEAEQQRAAVEQEVAPNAAVAQRADEGSTPRPLAPVAPAKGEVPAEEPEGAEIEVPKAPESATIAALRQLTPENTAALERAIKAKNAVDAIIAIFGPKYKGKAKNLAKRAEIWTQEMYESKQFKGKAEQNISILKYLEVKLREIKAEPPKAANPEPPKEPPAEGATVAPRVVASKPVVAPEPAPAVTKPAAPAATVPAAVVQPQAASEPPAPHPTEEETPAAEREPAKPLTFVQKVELLGKDEAPADLFAGLLKQPEEIKMLTTGPTDTLIIYGLGNTKNFKLLREFLQKPEAKVAIATMSISAAKPLIAKLHEVKDQKALDNVITNLDSDVKDNLIEDPSTPEEIRVKLHPIMAEAIKRLQLVRINKEYRRKSKDGTWKPGSYRFLNTQTNKVLYHTNSGVQAAVITAGETGEPKWEWIYKNENPEQTPEIEEKAEKDSPMRTIEDIALVDEKGKKIREIPKDRKVTILDTEIRIINERPHVKVRYHERNTEGWAEYGFLKKDDQEVAKLAEMDPEVKEIYTRYFINFDNVEKTTRKVPAGAYQLERRDTIVYQKTGATQASYEGDQMQYFTVKNPDVFKITKDGKEIYVVFAEDFSQQTFDNEGNPVITRSPGDAAENPGYININELIVGHGNRYTGTVEKAKIESDWTREPQELRQEETLITGKTYTLNKTTELHEQDHNFRRYLKKHPITVLDTQVRKVEGRDFVKVRIQIESRTVEGWIPLEDITIPEEDTMFVSDKDKVERPTASREGLRILGPYTITGSQKGSELLADIAKKYPTIETQLAESGISKPAYIRLLLEHREGNTLQIIEPTKTLQAKMAEFESQSPNTEYLTIQSEESERIFNNRESYLKKDFFLSDAKLKEYIQSDEKWNDVWDKIKEQGHGDEFIDGIEKVIDIYRQFGLQDIQIRDELRELLQIGINEKVTFEEIFERYAKSGKFKGIEYKEGNFGDFKKELDTLETDLKYWRSEQGQRDIAKIEHFHETLGRVDLAIRAAQAQGKDFMQTQEFQDYEKESAATEKIRQAYLYNQIPKKSQRLDHLRKTILNPIANLLDAIQGLSIKTSVEQSFYDRHEDMITRLPEMAPPLPQPAEGDERQPIIPSTYYDVESLATHQSGLPNAVERTTEGKTLIKIESEVKDKFETVRKEIAGENYKAFSEAAIIKMVFQLYSLETLAKEKCIKRVQGKKNEIVLIGLPNNFTKENPKLIELFTKVGEENQIDTHKELISKIAETLDENAAVLRRLTQIFGTDTGLEKDYGWTEHLKAFFSGEDVREISITMADIGARKVTKPSADLLNKYMSGKAEMTYIMDSISSVKEGIVSYSKEALTSELKKRLKIGIYNLFLNDEFKKVQESLEQKYKTKDKKELYRILSHNVEHLDHPLDTETIAIIRLGSVINQLIEENPETVEVELSKNPQIREIQEAAAKMGYPKKDIKQIEDTLLGGIVVSPTGGFSITTAVNIDLGHGFTATLGLSAGPGGVMPGAGISKTFEFTERTRLTVGIHGGPVSVGAHTNLEFPISDTVDGRVTGAAGITVIGFYAAGGIGIAINANAELAESFKEQIAKKGFTKVEELREKGASEGEIIKALMEVPFYGEEFKAAKTECQMSDKALLEVYEKLRTEIDAQVKQETAPSRVTFKFKGAGIAGGVINGIPFALPYIEFVIGERRVGVRTQVMGQETLDQFSQAELQAALTRAVGQNFELTAISTGETGQITLDAQGKMALLERTPQITDLREFDTLSQINHKLKDIKAEITQEPTTKLNQLHITVPGDLKVVADPKLGIHFMPHENKILFSGNNADISSLIITREDFFYPYKKDGAQSLTVLTISSNPRRGRLQIEKESPQIIYQREGYKPEIRKGIAKRGTSAITDMPTYMASLAGTAMPEGVERRNVEHFESWRSRIETATNRISSESFEGKPREGAIEAVAKEFLKTKTNRKLYRELSTLGNPKYNPDELNTILEGVAEKTKFGKLTALELAQLHIHLIRESFMNARQSMEVFKRNLEFAKKSVLVPFLTEITKKIEPPLASTPEQMAEQIGKDISEGLDLKSKDFATIDAGAYMLSVVGTMKIPGLRGTTYYGSALDKESGILNLQTYNPGLEGVKGDIGKALLELLSPIDRTDNIKFMESKLAIKLAAHDGMYLLLGAEDAMKVAECFEQKTVSEANSAAFEKFKQIVLKVREAQNAGRNFIDLPGGYQIRIETAIGVGAYEKCTNPTMVVSENITIWAPKLGTTVAGTRKRAGTDYMEEIKRETIILGLKLDFDEAPPGGGGGGGKPAKAPAGSGASTEETVGDTEGGASQTTSGQSQGGEAAGGFQSNE